MLTHVMKILYVANIRMPTEKAHGIQIAKTCEAFAKAGADVELVVPDRRTHITEDIASYYDLKKTFPITRLRAPDSVSWGFIGFLIESLVFAVAAARFARRRDAVVYGRDEIVLATIGLFTNREIVWESHTGAWNLFARYIARRAKKIVVISNGLRDFYISKGIPTSKIIVAHDGIDLSSFENPESKKDARARLRLSQHVKIALYIGALGTWKGTDTLMEASNFLPDDTCVAIVTSSDTKSLRTKYPRVLFLGEQPYRDIASNQAAADVLILPNSARDVIGARYTSPLKLFTYMASKRPIIVSDLPSMREVLSNENAYFFKADDANDLARAIREALTDPLARERAARAYEKVLQYSWTARAKRILNAFP